jgi:hypothetical protein
MSTIVAVSLAIIAVFFVYTLLAPAFFGLPGFMRPFALACPHKHEVGNVRVEGVRAAWTNAYGKPSLRVMACSLLPQGQTCDEGCVKNFNG